MRGRYEIQRDILCGFGKQPSQGRMAGTKDRRERWDFDIPHVVK